MIEQVRPYARQIIFLGDYVNRGEHSKEVLEFLVSLKARHRDDIFLCGNHDWAFLQYIDFKHFEQFALLGGLQTLASYLPRNTKRDLHDSLLAVMPSTHIEFLRSLSAYYEDEQLICSHAAISLRLPHDRSLAQMALISHPELFEAATEESKLVICGHYPQANLWPFQRKNLICLDTGCGTLPSGRLSALLLPEMDTLQVDDSDRVMRACLTDKTLSAANTIQQKRE